MRTGGGAEGRLGSIEPAGLSMSPMCILAACCHAMVHTRVGLVLLCLGSQDQPGGSLLVRCDPRQPSTPSANEQGGREATR